MKKPSKFIGMKFDKLLVIEQITNGHHPKVKCKCDCGRTVIRFIDTLTKKAYKQHDCGCIKHIQKFVFKYPPGEIDSSEYKIWSGIKSRCLCTSNKQYHNYGGRGIKLYEDWVSPGKGYLNFLSYVGRRPSLKHSIDRINNDGNYEPGNVRWSLQSQQVKNSRLHLAIENHSDEAIEKEFYRRHLDREIHLRKA